MKKYAKLIGIILCLATLVLMLVACNDACTSHVDENGDLKCDNCEADMSSTDEGNGDGGNNTTCTHVDADLSETCDLCGEAMPLNDGKYTYSVSITNGGDEGYANLLVEFNQNGSKVAMEATNSNGKIYIRLPQGSYTLNIIDPENRALEFDGELSLTATRRSLDIVAVANISTATTNTIMGIVDAFSTIEAYSIMGECAYSVEVNPNKILPIVWRPKQTGVYTFTLESEVGVKLTYHGIPQYVQENDCLDEGERISDESIKLTVNSVNLANPSAGIEETTPYVLGLKANVLAGKAILKIEKTAEAPKTYHDVPWTINNSAIPQMTISKDITKADLTYVKLDGTDTVVYNENDGLYHLNSVDGAILYVQLKYTPETLPDAQSTDANGFCFEALASNGRFGVTRLDENQDVISKISYHDHILALLEKVNAIDNNDEKVNNAGIYYLTTSMIDGIKDYGDYNGWWRVDGNCIFGESLANINPEYAWMFALCYIA